MCLNNYSINMNNAKVREIFKTSDKEICQICSEVDSFMVDIVNWADELGEILENEFTARRGSTEFLLPKTPSEKRIRNRKPRNALVSKCSVLNSTVDVSNVSNLNESVSTRTRSALRSATSKVSRLNVTNKVKEENISVDGKRDGIEKITGDSTDATFIVPLSTSTRTKPVLRNKKGDVTLSETSTSITAAVNTRITRSRVCSKVRVEERSANSILKNVNKSPAERPSRKKVSRHLSESPTERPSKKKFSRNISSSPAQRQKSKSVDENAEPTTTVRNNFSNPLIASPQWQIRDKSTDTLIQSPVLRSSRSNVSRTPTNTPLLRSGTFNPVRTSSRSPLTRSSRNNTATADEGRLTKNGVESNQSVTNKTAVIKKEATPRVTTSFVIEDEEEMDLTIDKSDSRVIDVEKTPKVMSGRFTRISKTSTPVPERAKTPLLSYSKRATEVIEDVEVTNTRGEISGSEKNKKDATYSVVAEPNSTVAEDESIAEEESVPKKKRKLKKKEEDTFKENVEEVQETGRITRTKSKAMKLMMEQNEVKQNDLSAFAKKLVNKAKMASLKKNQLAALLESNKSTPRSGPPGSMAAYNLPFGNLTSKSKYHLLLSGSKKLKTPLATLPNSAVKMIKGSEDKDRLKPRAEYTVENLVKTASKVPKDDAIERETKLKSKKKQEDAALKRQIVIKKKQEELKKKNELKHQLAMKQREKLEQEKHNNMIQLEREKEEKHKLILQERQMKLKEEAFKKKMLTQQKIAETGERRRLEEEARIAKLKEMEAEEQRLALEKQREQEKQEKRAQERLAEKKAREEYELQLKQEAEAERLRAEKTLTAKKFLSSASKLQSASKRPKFGLLGGEKKEWDYKPRNDSDYGLEDENSEMDSDDERSSEKTKSPVRWAKRVLTGRCPVIRMTLDMLREYMHCYQKTPDIHKMFKMTPSKRIKRTSSAIWNTPSS